MTTSVLNPTSETAAGRFDNRDAEDLGKLPSLQASVAPFDPDWSFSHHAAIIRFKGKWIAMWSSGRRNEDDLGQRVCFAASEDFLHWSIPKPLMDSRMGEHSECVLFANGFYSDGNTLYAYLRCSEYRAELLRENNTLRPDGGTANELEAHTDADSDGKCDVCGYVIGSASTADTSSTDVSSADTSSEDISSTEAEGSGTDKAPADDGEGGLPVGIIIGIAAAAAVVIAVVIVIVIRKKKA